MNDEMMFCPHCGKQIKKDTKFCPYCGKKIIVITEDKSEENVNQDVTNVQNIEPPKSDTNLPINDEVEQVPEPEKSDSINKEPDTVTESTNEEIDPTTQKNVDQPIVNSQGSSVNTDSSNLNETQGIKLEFTNNAFQNIFKWLAANIYLTAVCVFALFIIFSFSRLLGWILAIAGLIAVYVIVSNKKVTATNVETSIKGKVKQGVGNTIKETGQSVTQTVQSTVSNSKAQTNQSHWNGARITFLVASIVTFLSTYVGSFVSANAMGFTARSNSLYELVQSASSISQGINQFTGGTSGTSDASYFMILLIVGIGPFLGMIFSLMKSNKLPLIAGVITAIGYILLMTVFSYYLGSASQIFSPGISCIVAMLGAVAMIVSGILLMSKKSKANA